ncbi:syntaxin-12 [Ixodes scapularis]
MAGRYTTYNTGGSNMSSGFENYQNASQNIGTNIQKMTQNVVSMNKMVQQLGTSQDSGTLRAQLLQIQQYTQQLAKDTNRQLRELVAPKLVKDKLTNEFSEALRNFQLVQRAEADKEKDSVKRARAASGLALEPQQQPGRRGNLIELASPQQPEPPQQQQQSYAMMDEQVNLEMLREREQAISKLESDIQDVNSIFKDLATMVHDQGDMIGEEASLARRRDWVKVQAAKYRVSKIPCVAPKSAGKIGACMYRFKKRLISPSVGCMCDTTITSVHARQAVVCAQSSATLSHVQKD